MTSMPIHRTTVDIDLDLYEEARAVLGTRGYRDTIEAALRETARRERLRRAADLIRSGALNLVTPEELEALRRPRHVE
jgi:Arc/MetJ family transcription regulator